MSIASDRGESGTRQIRRNSRRVVLRPVERMHDLTGVGTSTGNLNIE